MKAKYCPCRSVKLFADIATRSIHLRLSRRPRRWLPGVNDLCIFLHELRSSGRMSGDWHFGPFELLSEDCCKMVIFGHAEDAFAAMTRWDGKCRAVRGG